MLHARLDWNQMTPEEFYAHIPPDEPVFMVRAQDLVASDTVRHWAWLNDLNGGDPKLSHLAIKQAELMEAWPVHKLADLTPGESEPVPA